MREFIRGYGVKWIVLHVIWTAALIFWFYQLYSLHSAARPLTGGGWMTKRERIRQCLEEGMSREQAWRATESTYWHVSWNYVCYIAREWEHERTARPMTGG